MEKENKESLIKNEILESAVNKFKDVLSRTELNGETLSLLVDNSEFWEIVGGKCLDFAVPNPHKKEIMKTARSYSKSNPSIFSQIDTMAKLFYLNKEHADKYATKVSGLSCESVDYFAIPKISALAKRFFPEVTCFDEQYQKCLEYVVENTGCFRKRDAFSLKSGVVRLTSRTKELMSKIESEQEGDIVIIKAQLGELHGGKSVGKVREEFLDNKFGLGAFHVACILLSNQSRLKSQNCLGVDCPGDEFRRSKFFTKSTNFAIYRNGGPVEIGLGSIDYYDLFFGSATAFYK